MAALVAGSLVLLLGASISLGFGWIGSNSTLVWLSIACSTGTAVALVAAYSRSKQLAETARRRVGPRSQASRRSRRGGAGAAGGFATQAMARPDTRTRDRMSPNDGEVVAVPERRKFHRSECRYARVRGATKMTRSAARRRNFDACGICKP
ncbi:MAG: hypothetical protein M3343_01160 [Actinomycetota bacterium]|nr:hypothetical protein [Actinomycetota bacterium]